MYQASSSRALKPALDAVDLWTAVGADNDERSTSKQKEIIEGLRVRAVRRWQARSEVVALGVK